MYTEALRREVEVDYVRKLIRTFHIPARELDIPHWPWPIRIYTLGRFAILKDDVAIRVCGKAEQRPIDLLVALIALGGREVSIRELLIQVWPQLGPNARAAFDVALMRLRRSLGAEVVEVGRGRLTLNNACCWVDAWAFERIAARATKDRSPEVYECVLERYRGPFMREETEIPCVVAMRDRLATKFQRSVLQAGQAFERSGDFDRAAEAYRAGLEHDNLVEEFHRRLIYCEWKLGHRAEALKSYRRCKDLLRLHLHTGPSPETRALYRDLIVDPPP